MLITQCIASRSGLFNAESFSTGRVTLIGPDEHPGARSFAIITHSLLADIASGQLSHNPELWQDFYLQMSINSAGAACTLTRSGNDRLKISFKEDGKEHDLLKIPDNAQADAHGPLSGLIALLFRLTPATIGLLCLPDSELLPQDSLPSLISLLSGQQKQVLEIHGLLQRVLDDHNSDPLYAVLRQKITGLKKEIHETGRELQIMDLRSHRAEKIGRERADLEEQITHTKSEMDELLEEKTILATALARIDDLHSNENECARLKDQIKELDTRAAGLKEQKAAHKTQFPAMSALTAEQRQGLDTVQQMYHTLRTDIEKYETIVHNEEVAHNRAVYTIAVLLLATIIPVILYLGGIINPATDLARNIVRFFLPASGITLSAGILGYLKLRTRRLMRQDPLARREACINEFSTSLDQFGITLPVHDVDEVYEYLLQYFEEYGRFLDSEHEIAELAGAIDTEPARKEIQPQLRELESRGDQMRHDLSQLLARIKGSFPLKPEPDSIHAAMAQIGEKQTILEKKLTMLEALAAEMDKDLQRQTDPTSTSAAQHRLSQQNESLSRLTRRHTSLAILHQALSDSIAAREQAAAAKFEEKAAGYLAQLAGETAVNSEHFAAFLHNEPTDLSSSERYLARIAIALAAQDLLEESHAERLPLILSQPDRLLGKSSFSQLENLLATSSPNQQFIILVGDENAYSGCDSIIRLREL